MPNQLGLAGAQPQKQTKYAAIYTPRWVSGLWTNRSPLRDATTTRQTEKYYGPAGDALISGLNTEISEKLTLIRRPGNSIYGTNSWNAVDRFYDFRLFNAATEQITLMVDQADGLYSLNAPQNAAKSLVWSKSPGAGQTYMQSVGNTLFFGNGVDNKKWLQTLFKWTPNTALNTSTGLNPFLSTFFIDPNGNIQQLTATVIPVNSVVVQNDTVQIFTSGYAGNALTAGQTITFPSTGMNATFLEGQTVTLVAVYPNTFVFYLVAANYALTAETGIYATVDPGDGSPTTGPSQPTWSLTVPNAGNDFQGGTTIDGTAQWTNRGNPVKNWGIANSTAPIVPTEVGGAIVWQNSTYYSLVSVIIDSNGNLQQVTRAGLSAATHPVWATTLNTTTLDGLSATGASQGVIWTMIASAAQMNWQANTFYPTGSFLIETASGTPCLFQSGPPTTPYLSGTVSAYLWAQPHSGTVGQWDGTDPYNGTTNPSGLPYPTNAGSSYAQASGLTGFDFSISGTGTGGSFAWNTINSAGQVTGTTNPFPGVDVSDNYIIITGTIEVPVAGTYTFTVSHGDGFQMGIGGGAICTGGTAPAFISGTNTALNGYPFANQGHNQNVTSNSGNQWVDTYNWQFPTAGTYPIEVNMSRWDKPNAGLSIKIAGSTIPSGQPSGGATSGSTVPTWPAWTTADAPGYPNVLDPSTGRLQWNNIGPAADFVWAAAKHFTLPNTKITDPNNNIEAPYRTGYTLSTGGQPTYGTTLNALTTDNPNLIWINQGPTTAPPVGTLTTATGWRYAVSLVDTLDNTVSNATKLSAIVGPFTDATGVQIPPGAGLPPLNKIDEQSDYVAIWRTTDGQDVGFLIPSTTTDYSAPVTISLAAYLQNGYLDTTADTSLNNLITAPSNGENTPPAPGAINLVYYQNRLFYTIGATGYWTTGPLTPVGNGLNGSSPLNYDEQASLVSRLVPTTSGLFVFTVSDTNLIQSSTTATNGFNPAVPLLEGIGLLSYNALDVNGSIIGFFTTDHQFVIIDPSSGVSSAGYPLGDQFRLNNGMVGQSWNPSNVYVAWHVNGEDQGWYVGDGTQGWYRLMATPAPESGNYTWAPFAQIQSGVKALQSIEVSPGSHQLLLGPTGTGNILYRDLNTNQDGGVSYPCYAVLGSCVLAQPGQYAVVPFITVETVGTGIPPVLGVLIDEALPYYKGPFEILKKWVNDPPNLKPSISMPAQRFYLSDDTLPASMRSMQIQVSWPAQNVPSELLTLTVFGGFMQEL